MHRRRTPMLYRAVLGLGSSGADTLDVFEQWLDALASQHGAATFSALPGRPILGGMEVVTSGLMATVVENRSAWACHVTTVDDAEGEEDAPRWIVSAAIYESTDGQILDIAHFVNLPDDQRAPRRIPDVLRSVLADVAVHDGYALDGKARLVDTRDDIAEFLSILQDEHRALPIVAISEPYLVDADALAGRLLGVAHVVRIANEASFALSHSLGKEWSVYGGAVRTYKAPFSPRHDQRSDHPLALASAIGEYGRHVFGYASFTDSLINRAFGLVSSMADRYERRDSLWLKRQLLHPSRDHQTPIAPEPEQAAAEQPPPPPIAEVQPDTRETPTAESADLAELLTAENERLANENADLSRFNDELQRTLVTMENDYYALLAEFEELKARRPAGMDDFASGVRPSLRPLLSVAKSIMDAVHGLGADFDAIEEERRALAAARYLPTGVNASTSTDVVEPFPATLAPDIVQAWAQRKYAGKLILHPRALDGLRDSQYERAQDVYAALDLLATEYRTMRLRKPDEDHLRVAYEKALSNQRLIACHSMASETDHRLSRFYNVLYNGRERELDLHLKNTTGTTDPRRCLRIYYFFDEASGVVVVGWLPSHLPNKVATT